MLKNIFIFLFLLCTGPVFANITEEYINIAKSEVFSKDLIRNIETTEFKDIVAKHKKDNNYLENYYAAQSGYKYFKNNNLNGIFTKMDIMYMYTLQERSNLRVIYYYDIFGNLKDIEFLYGNYPAYPYFSRKYTVKGKFKSAAYYFNKSDVVNFDKSGNTKQ